MGCGSSTSVINTKDNKQNFTKETSESSKLIDAKNTSDAKTVEQEEANITADDASDVETNDNLMENSKFKEIPSSDGDEGPSINSLPSIRDSHGNITARIVSECSVNREEVAPQSASVPQTNLRNEETVNTTEGSESDAEKMNQKSEPKVTDDLQYLDVVSSETPKENAPLTEKQLTTQVKDIMSKELHREEQNNSMLDPIGMATVKEAKKLKHDSMKHENMQQFIREANQLKEDTGNKTENCTSPCSTYTDDSSCVDVEMAENILSNVLVNDVISSLAIPQQQDSGLNEQDKNDKGEVPKAVKDNEDVDTVTCDVSAGIVVTEIKPENVTEDNKAKSVIAPSSGPTLPPKPIFHYEDTENDISLHSACRISCEITDNQQLVKLASQATALYMDRSLPTIAEVVAAMPSLRKLDVSGNHSGPVAVRTILSILTAEDSVEHIDLSDNMADSECVDHLGKLISSSKNLKWLNVSSNSFGKESLNRCLSSSVSVSTSLTYLDISGCGAMNFHGLFEAMRQGYTNDTLPLSYLDISSNFMNDGQQLGIDLSLILEIPACALNVLKLNSTGLNSAGWVALMSGLQSNTSLTELSVGGSENHANDLSALVKMMGAGAHLSKLSMAGVKVDNEAPFEDEILPLLHITDLDIGNCGLVDDVFVKLAKSSQGCLSRLESLNLTGNAELTSVGFEALDTLCSMEGASNLKQLNLSLLEVEHLPVMLNKCFKNLSHLNIRKARITSSALADLSTIPQTLEYLVLDGIKLSKTGALATVLGVDSKHQLKSLSASNCGLTDADSKPITDALGRISSPLQSLTNLDLSSNRLTDATLVSLSEQLTKTPKHPLQMLDVSNNICKDEGAVSISKLIMSATAESNVQHVAISNNQLTASGITSLTSALRSGSSQRGLISLDVGNQKDGLDEDEANDVVANVSSTLGIDSDGSDEVIPMLPVTLNVNLVGLGGAVGGKIKTMNSSAIKTDFSKICRNSANLTDYLLLGAGLEKKLGIDSNNKMQVSFSSSEWVSVVGKDAPAWLKVESDRGKGVYINHLPGTATVQRLEGMLEMEADCQVNDVYIVKDPIMRKPTGAAWVLFESEGCVQKVLEWCNNGEAVMYGSPFSVSKLPVAVLDEQKGAEVLAKRDLALREKQRRENEQADLKVLEESQKLADERAAYREAHPAYQGGRIW